MKKHMLIIMSLFLLCTGCSNKTSKKEVIVTPQQEEIIHTAILNILQDNTKYNDQLYYHIEHHTVIKIEETSDTMIAYMALLTQSYLNSEKNMESGYNDLARLTFKKEHSTYKMTDFWTPEDGTRYFPSIQEEFPEDIVYGTQKNVDYTTELKEMDIEKARAFFQAHQ